MLRCCEPGWVELCRPDGRRGVWMRVTKESIELCAGREGDDDYLFLVVGEPVTERDLHEASNILLTFGLSKALAEQRTKRGL